MPPTSAPTSIMLNQGYTLAEQLVCVAIIALLSATALPSMNDWVNDTKAQQAGRSLFHLMQYGRHAAIRHKHPITICQIKNPSVGDCTLEKNWRYPYYVFVDVNRDKKLTLPAADMDNDKSTSSNNTSPNKQDILLRSYPAVAEGDDLITNQKLFYFWPAGTTNTPGSITYCPKYSQSATRIVVMTSGRARYARQSEINCPT